MNMKLKNILILLMLISVFPYFNCGKNFLESPSRETFIREEYVKDLETSKAYLNGIYIYLCAFNNYTHAAYPEMIADNLKAVPSRVSRTMLAPYSWTQQATEENEFEFGYSSLNTNGMTRSAYRMINSCNFLVSHIDKFRTENPGQADDIKGQAYLIRSLAYFQLVNIYAQSYNYTPDASHPGVAYVTSDDWTDHTNGRQSVAEVYNGMISDLQNAIDLLPASTTSALVPSKITARALMSRVLLFKGDYTGSKNQAVEVMKVRGLLNIANGYPDNLFKSIAPQQTETLLQLVPEKFIPGGSSLFAGRYLGNFLRVPVFVAASDISGMLRVNGDDARSKWITPDASGFNVVTKFPLNVVGTGAEERQYYHCLIRSSEACLNAAESYAQLNMADSARYYLYQIQKRADPDAVAPIVSGTMLMNAIKAERRKELAFEGLRMYDLQRWKQGVFRSDPAIPEAEFLPYPSDKAISPIPLLDVKVHNFSQNPGY